jgi:hypothetical protein
MVVMPDFTAASSTTPVSVCEPISLRTGLAHRLGQFEAFEHAGTAAIACAAATLATRGLAHFVARHEAEHAVARVGREVGGGELLLDAAAVAQQAHETLRDHGAQR